MDCKTCKETREGVPYIVHESAMMRADRHCKKLFIALILVILLLVATNAAWLITWNQYDFESYEQDGNGINIIGSSNEVEQFESANGGSP